MNSHAKAPRITQEAKTGRGGYADQGTPEATRCRGVYEGSLYACAPNFFPLHFFSTLRAES